MNETTKKRDEKFGIYLYILELQNGKYYVGITNNPENRFRKHRSGKSFGFISKNLPIINIQKRLLKTTDRNRALKLETEKTIELIEKFGIANVCGGTITGDFHDRIFKFKSYFNKLMNSNK
jgi:predicted GIY-YIG superfamily endonuclease